MSASIRIVLLLLLIAALIQGAALLAPPQLLVRIPGYQYLWLNEAQQAAAAADYLDRLYRETKSFTNNGWTLRFVEPRENLVIVVAGFPSNGSRVAPLYRELVRFCPVKAVDGYWEKRYARPVELFLVSQGSTTPRSIAHCDPGFDEQALNRISYMPFTGPDLEVLPRAGDDVAALETAVEAGSPSYARARSAVYSFDAKLLLDYLRQRPELALMYDSSGHTLMHAAESGAAVKLLLAFGANPNVQVTDGPTLLTWMAELGSCDAIRQLFYEGMANASLAEPEFAATTECAQLLLDNGAPIRDRAVFRALHSGRLDVARLLRERGGDISKASLDHPLRSFAGEAQQYASEKAVDKFIVALELGADPNERFVNKTIFEWLQEQENFAGRDRMLQALKRALAHEQN